MRLWCRGNRQYFIDEMHDAVAGLEVCGDEFNGVVQDEFVVFDF